ncbi:MAG: SGNH/GDSL hydrolase family protein [Candidatus Binatia bacterium]
MNRFGWLIGVSLFLCACSGGGSGGSGGIGLEDVDGDGQIVIIAFGDSITRGQGDGDSPDDVPPTSVAGYPARLQARTGVVVSNAGVGGEQTPSGRARLRDLLASGDSDYVILLEGVNDLERRREGDALVNLQAMIDDVIADGGIPIIGTLTPSCCNHRNSVPADRVHRFNESIRAMAAQNSIPLVDFYKAFVPDITVSFDPASGLLHVEEGLHPTSAGYDVMADAAFDVFF